MKKNEAVRYTAEQFWQLLPRAIVALRMVFHKEGNVLDMRPRAKVRSGRRNPAPGEPIDWYIQSNPSCTRFDPLTAVVWLVTDQYKDVGNPYPADCLGLNRTFQTKLRKAIYMMPGYSVQLLKRLHKELPLDMQWPTEPTRN